MKAFDRVMYVMDYINSNGGRSHNRINEMYASGELEKVFNHFNLDDIIRNELLLFVRLIFDKNIEYYPATKSLYLYNTDILKIFDYYSYEVGTRFDDSDSYHRLPRFIKSGLLKYGIVCDFNELDKRIYKYLDINTKYDLNRNREEQDILLKQKQSYIDYNYYLDMIKSGKFTLNDRNTFFIFSELFTFNNETSLLDGSEFHPLWVAKDYGDGYGYDILSYDKSNNREKAIEVKSTRVDSFSLTKNEYNALKRFKDYKYVDYFIYQYDYNKGVSRYQYDYSNDVLRNIGTNDIVELEEDIIHDEVKRCDVNVYKPKVLKKTH